MDDMKYEDIAEIDTSKRIKQNKRNTEMKRKEKFSLLTTDIAKMRSSAIIWHLIKRHKFGIVLATSIIQFGLSTHAIQTVLEIAR